ncbi:MAG: hypothetical protein IPM95_04990 [Sphingobacteriales bacterium]|nr:hypothetical protein [Sphingobacteriales bacterium]
MRNLILLLLTMGSFTIHSAAQTNRVILCDSYDDNGVPTGVNKNWDISKNGSYVYILYTQDKPITNKLLLYVDKKTAAGSYAAFDTQDFTYDPKTDRKKFAVYDYKFTESGDYKISVVSTGDNKELASSLTNIAFMKDEKVKEKSTDANDTYYYENSTMIFGDSVDAKAVVKGEAGTFKLINGKRDIVVKLSQDEDLNVTQIIMDVYGGTDYKEKIYSKTFDIASKTWNWVKMPVNFTKTGKYVIDLYTQDDVFINSGYVEITR